MFVGHFAIALGAKKASPRSSLGTLFAACQLLDLIWPVLLLLGIEHASIRPGETVYTPLNFYDYPWSHSLVTSLIWSVLFGGLVFALGKDLRSAAVSGIVVFSHWLLDAASHGPDMPIYPGGEQFVGLGLWNSVPATVIVETAMFAAGIFIYARATEPRDRRGRYAFWALIAFLSLIDVANMTSPPPPSMLAVAWSALALVLLPPWAAWADRHRRLRVSE